MSKYWYEVAVGVVFMAAMAILGFYTIFMMQKKFIAKNAYTMTVNFKNVEGLKTGNDVRVTGVAAGEVKRIELQDYNVRVTLIMNKRFTMHENYEIVIVSDTALGGKSVSIHPGTPSDAKGRVYAVITDYSNLRGTYSDPFGTIARLVENNETSITATIHHLDSITGKIDRGEGTIGKLINQDVLHTQAVDLVKELRETVENAREQAPITSFIRAALTAF